MAASLFKAMEIATYSMFHLICSNVFFTFQKADFDRLPHVRQDVRRQIQFDHAKAPAAVDEYGAFLGADDASGFGIAVGGCVWDGGFGAPPRRRPAAAALGQGVTTGSASETG